MKLIETKQKELYETPAVFDIKPMTIDNVKGENSQQPDGYDDSESPS